jgi:hypothetical protein
MAMGYRSSRSYLQGLGAPATATPLGPYVSVQAFNNSLAAYQWPGDSNVHAIDAGQFTQVALQFDQANHTVLFQLRAADGSTQRALDDHVSDAVMQQLGRMYRDLVLNAGAGGTPVVGRPFNVFDLVSPAGSKVFTTETGAVAPLPPSPFTYVMWGLSTVSMAASVYHGYKRNNSVGWALWWGLMGALFPIITPVIAFAEGYGKRAGGR